MKEKSEVVGLLLVSGFALMSYACVVEPLRAANLLAGRDLYRWIHISPGEKTVTASCGATVPCPARVGDCESLDLLLVVAGGDPATFRDQSSSPGCAAWRSAARASAACRAALSSWREPESWTAPR
jgi:transcriptional regulator GlxA family with amidase domain